ncbi:MAG TPA: C1 family peptidase, partial [Prolixibacteraceae bacterium]|nr:C1 family peptidase [Prolixibacteraceae bacterium]
DLSEMFFVYHAYQDKAKHYLKSDGKSRFSQGGQAHDVIKVLETDGMVPQIDFVGEKQNGEYVHRPLARKLKKQVEKLQEKDNPINIEKNRPFTGILKKGLGKTPKKVKFDNQKFSPAQLRDKFEIDPTDYIEITSYSHHPFYERFALDVPDNWSKDLYYNLPIDELLEVMYYSLENGYTICWDGDTSEKTFRPKKGYANLHEKYTGKVTQDLRQETFNDKSTTDDHLMHIVGLSKNTGGEKCFYTKNSWGKKSNKYGGYLHLSEDYVKLKTIAILVHKDAVPLEIKNKLNL